MADGPSVAELEAVRHDPHCNPWCEAATEDAPSMHYTATKVTPPHEHVPELDAECLACVTGSAGHV